MDEVIALRQGTSRLPVDVQGLIANGFAFVPQSIGDSYSAQAEWISAMWPHYSASLIEVIQGIYNADTFGTLQLATNLM